MKKLLNHPTLLPATSDLVCLFLTPKSCILTPPLHDACQLFIFQGPLHILTFPLSHILTTSPATSDQRPTTFWPISNPLYIIAFPFEQNALSLSCYFGGSRKLLSPYVITTYHFDPSEFSNKTRNDSGYREGSKEFRFDNRGPRRRLLPGLNTARISTGEIPV
jgi:hypothetical protein